MTICVCYLGLYKRTYIPTYTYYTWHGVEVIAAEVSMWHGAEETKGVEFRKGRGGNAIDSGEYVFLLLLHLIPT